MCFGPFFQDKEKPVQVKNGFDKVIFALMAKII